MLCTSFGLCSNSTQRAKKPVRCSAGISHTVPQMYSTRGTPNNDTKMFGKHTGKFRFLACMLLYRTGYRAQEENCSFPLRKQ